MPGKRAYLEHLSQVPLFSSLGTRELQRVARATDEVQLPAGTTIIDQGQAGREAFIIVDGSATVRRNGRKVTTLGPGAIVGELALLDHGPRTASVTCDTDCTLLVIEARAFNGILDEVPTLSHKLLATLASRIRQVDKESYG